jgi:Heavy metal binding domain
MKSNRIESSFIGRRLARSCALVVAAALAFACMSTTPPEGANDPSFAQAETAPAPETSPVLDEGHAPLPDVAAGPVTPATADAQNHTSHQTAATNAATSNAATSTSAAHDHAQHDSSKQQAPMYVCPMHPEVRQAGPGRCPKCGMALELEEAKPKTK